MEGAIVEYVIIGVGLLIMGGAIFIDDWDKEQMGGWGRAGTFCLGLFWVIVAVLTLNYWDAW